GRLDADGNPNFFSLACGGLYFGGSGVGVPLPSIVPNTATSLAKVACSGTTLTLSGLSAADAGGDRCSGGSNHHNACTTSADCPETSCRCGARADPTPGGTARVPAAPARPSTPRPARAVPAPTTPAGARTRVKTAAPTGTARPAPARQARAWARRTQARAA